MALKEFAKKFWAQSEWRRRANGLADALVKDRARRIAAPGGDQVQSGAGTLK